MQKIGLHLELLNSFEVSVVVMIVLGFAITGLVFFSSLTPRLQTNVASSFEIFDIHQQVAKTLDTVGFAYDTANEFYNQFYVAFTQVASVPSDVIDTSSDFVTGFASTFGKADYYKKIATNFTDYTGDLFYRVSLNYSSPTPVGQVAGASVSLFDQYAAQEEEMYFNKPVLAPAIPYTYESPKLNQIFSKVDWMKVK